MRTIILFGLLACGFAQAADPQLGGPMKHILVSLTGTQINVVLEGDPNEVLEMRDYGDTYNGPATVLNGRGYNAQYGWLASGFFNLPPGSGVFVEVLEQTPGLDAYDAFTFQPILGTAGSAAVWQWSGVMTHNWYAADACGSYEALCRVYVGQSDGTPYPGYTPATVRLLWRFAPELAGDFSGDGRVDLSDLAVLLGNFGRTDLDETSGDTDGDADADLSDLARVLAEFGQDCPA